MRCFLPCISFLLSLGCSLCNNTEEKGEVFLPLTTVPTIRPAKLSSDELVDFFIHSGVNPTPLHLWRSVAIVINFTSGPVDPDFYLKHSENQTELIEAIRSGSNWFEVPWRSNRLSPFVDSFVAISSRKKYAVSVRISPVDVRLVLLTVGGILIFFNGRRLARNAAFFYSTGVGFMLLGSVLVVILLISRIIPKRSFGMSVLIGGWSFGGYLLYWIASNISEICLQHYRLLAGYIVTVALISFAFLYRLGPPTSRSLNLAQWGMQIVGLTLIHFGCQIPEVSAALTLLSLVGYNLPQTQIKRLFSRVRWRYFPPPRRLLTEEQYHQQGQEETRKALADLREFCRSPNCSAWKTLSRLNSPARFAQFVEGGSHLSDAEVLNFDATEWFGRNGSDKAEIDDEFLTDDDDSDDIVESMGTSSTTRGYSSRMDFSRSSRYSESGIQRRF